METKKQFNKNNDLLMKIARFMLAIGLLISIYFIISSGIDGYWIWGKEKINFSTTGQFGDFFGGVVGTFFALTGTLLIILTFRIQSKQYERDAFESKFYEMLKLHSENVKEIQVANKKGREAIEYLTNQLHTIFIDVENAFIRLKTIENPEEIDSNYEDLRRIKIYLNDVDKNLLLVHKIAYGYFFYGIEQYHITNDKTDVIYDINLAVTVIIKSRLLSVSEGSVYNAGTHYNSLLGHYYRQLFQLIKLVASDNILEEKEKYEFSKIVRAQLSDYEQILLYYNSLSVMGAKWITPLGMHDIEKMCFIARFKLINNIPYYFHYFGLKPAILFETEKKAWESSGESFFELDLEN